jgi:hypothetical protein
MNPCFEDCDRWGGYCRFYVMGDCILPPECGKSDPTAQLTWERTRGRGCQKEAVPEVGPH